MGTGMFKWLRSFGRRKPDTVHEPPPGADRDTGEEEYESHEEDAEEIAPSRLTRTNTDEI